PAILHVANQAHDLPPWALPHASKTDVLADGVLTGEKRFRESLIYDHNQRRAFALRIGKRSPPQ
ncbi:MAG: hypothetical protein JO099_09040, partial [Acidobacteriia bacterium]|nr:hypothetical protein [Terriglobia bacterium]